MPILTLTQQQVLEAINKRFNPAPLLITRSMIFAFCDIESSFNPYAYRFEQKLGEASYGLMQILVSTARDRGFNGDPKELWEIDAGIEYGLRQLVWIRDYVGSHGCASPAPIDFAASYNAGVGNFLHGFRPIGYISSFSRSLSRWQLSFGESNPPAIPPATA